jgi:ADP-ribose pyrophosphatase
VPHQIRKVFEGRVFSVVVESIDHRKGGKMDVEFVRHPGSVVLIPLTAANDVIPRPSVPACDWTICLGTARGDAEAERRAEEAAARECHEEIGLLPGHLEELGSYFPTPGYCDEEMTFYKATGLREAGPDDETAQQDEDEDIEKEAFSLEQIRSMIRSGEIIDMKTVAGVALL